MNRYLTFLMFLHVKIPSKYPNLPHSLTNSGIEVLLLSLTFATSSQTVPPSATKYSSLNSADLYQDGNELKKKTVLPKILYLSAIFFL